MSEAMRNYIRENPNWLQDLRLMGMQFPGSSDGCCDLCQKYIPSRESQHGLVQGYKTFVNVNIEKTLCGPCQTKKFENPNARLCKDCTSKPPDEVRIRKTMQVVRSTEGMFCEDCRGNAETDEFDLLVSSAKKRAKKLVAAGDMESMDEFCLCLEYDLPTLRRKAEKPRHNRRIEELENILGSVRVRMQNKQG